MHHCIKLIIATMISIPFDLHTEMYFILLLGTSVLSGQLSIPVPAIEAEVNISQIPDGSRDVVMEYLMSNNITVTDNLTNVSSNSLCTSTAAQIRDVLITFTSFEIDCDPECGKKFTNDHVYTWYIALLYSFITCRY